MSNWQLCPKCNGTGTIELPIWATVPLTPEKTPEELMDELKKTGTSFYQKMDDNFCPVCQGKMIISVFTGKPPVA